MSPLKLSFVSPKVNCSKIASSRECLSIWTEGYRPFRVRKLSVLIFTICGECIFECTCMGIPKSDVSVSTCTCKRFPTWTERYVFNPILMSSEYFFEFSCVNIPQLDCSFTCTCKSIPIWTKRYEIYFSYFVSRW